MPDLFDFAAPSNHFAVLGNPVAHSQSPRIHQLFAQQFALDLDYRRIQVDVGGFAQAVSHFAAHGGAGLNITLPFKVEAWRLCRQPGNQMSDRAGRAEAVNTLRFAPDQSVFGDNTDGIGMRRDLENNLGLAIAGKHVLLLGAGGAARGVLGPLAQRRPASLRIANRTADKAQALAARFSLAGEHGDSQPVRGYGYQRLADAAPDWPAFDLVINASAASLAGELPDLGALRLAADSLAYDLMYAAEPTVFMRWGQAHGARLVSDGLGMLVEQAAESFNLWHDRRPDSAAVIRALRGV